MNGEESKGCCGGSKDDTLRSMAGDFYNRKMLPFVILVWAYSLAFIAGAIYSGIKFFDAEDAKCQIMFAVIFVCCFQFICLMKLFAWGMIHRVGIKRAIKRLEKLIAEKG